MKLIQKFILRELVMLYSLYVVNLKWFDTNFLFYKFSSFRKEIMKVSLKKSDTFSLIFLFIIDGYTIKKLTENFGVKKV